MQYCQLSDLYRLGLREKLCIIQGWPAIIITEYNWFILLSTVGKMGVIKFFSPSVPATSHYQYDLFSPVFPQLMLHPLVIPMLKSLMGLHRMS